MKLRVFTAFSGYDSQCMALDRIGIDYELVGWSEIDKYAIAAHNAVYPQYAGCNYGDISKIDWAQVPDFDLFTYSSPCQDFSAAGLQRGGTKGSGTRSSLLWECERAIAAKRPKYLLFENVAALVSQKFIRLFNEWQLLLERMGYTNFTQVLNAKDYGVPQNRERVFMASIRDCEQPYYFPKPIPLTKRIKDVLEDNVPEKYDLSRRMMKWLEEHDWQCLCNETKGFMFKPKNGNDIANALRANGAFSPTDNAIRDSNRIRRLTPKECFRLMGVADTDSDKITAVLSKSRCYQVAGNSIVVDVLAAIFDQLFNGNKNTNQQTELF